MSKNDALKTLAELSQTMSVRERAPIIAPILLETHNACLKAGEVDHELLSHLIMHQQGLANTDVLLAHLQKAYSKAPYNSNVISIVAQIMEKRDPQQALQWFEEATSRLTKDTALVKREALLLVKLKRYDDAAEVLETFLSDESLDDDEVQDLSDFLSKIRDKEISTAIYTSSKNNPLTSEFLRSAEVQDWLDQRLAKITDQSSTDSTKKRTTKSVEKLIVASGIANDQDAAWTTAERVIATDSEFLTPRIFSQAAKAATILGNNKTALSFCEEGLKKFEGTDEDISSILFQQSWAYAATGESRISAAITARAHRFYPEDMAIATTFAWNLCATGQSDEAKKVIKPFITKIASEGVKDRYGMTICAIEVALLEVGEHSVLRRCYEDNPGMLERIEEQSKKLRRRNQEEKGLRDGKEVGIYAPLDAPSNSDAYKSTAWHEIEVSHGPVSADARRATGVHAASGDGNSWKPPGRSHE